jgi:hypothetical protein
MSEGFQTIDMAISPRRVETISKSVPITFGFSVVLSSLIYYKIYDDNGRCQWLTVNCKRLQNPWEPKLKPYENSISSKLYIKLPLLAS